MTALSSRRKIAVKLLSLITRRPPPITLPLHLDDASMPLLHRAADAGPGGGEAPGLNVSTQARESSGKRIRSRPGEEGKSAIDLLDSTKTCQRKEAEKKASNQKARKKAQIDSLQLLAQHLLERLHHLLAPRLTRLLIITLQRESLLAKPQHLHPSPLLALRRPNRVEELVGVGVEELGRFLRVPFGDPGGEVQGGDVAGLGEEVHAVAAGGFDVALDLEGLEERADGGGDLGEEVEEGGGGLELEGVGVEDLDGFFVDLEWVLVC